MWEIGQRKQSSFKLDGIMLVIGHLTYPANVPIPGLLVMFKLFRNACSKGVVMRSGRKVHSSDVRFSLTKRVIDLNRFLLLEFVYSGLNHWHLRTVFQVMALQRIKKHSKNTCGRYKE